MSRCWIDLGSNLDRETSLRRALEALSEDFGPILSSHAYRSAPVGFTEQPDFYNLCAQLESALSPADLRLHLRQLEDRLGRVRGPNKYGPRTIDLDLVLHESAQDERLPHPQVESQGFVLVPLCELVPEFVHPRLGLTLAQLLERLNLAAGAVSRIDLPGLPWGR